MHATCLGISSPGEIEAELVDVSEWTPRTWRHICLPACYEANHPHPFRTDLYRKRTGQIWVDERKVNGGEGVALWPALFPVAELDLREAHPLFDVRRQFNSAIITLRYRGQK
jgi:hypothetical protein